ncbi:MAG: acyl-CoA dehydrogenase family protein [Acidimicrobiia bacterium]
MDFGFGEEQQTLAELAAQIFGGYGDIDRIKAIEASEDRVDRELWRELAQTNLLGIPLPESAGGSGFGVVEAAILLEAQGANVSPVPLWPTLLAAMAIAEHGGDALQSALLPGVVTGETMLTVALSDAGSGDPLLPSVAATPDADGWRLDGTKLAVPSAHVASAIVVTAVARDGLGVFVVDASAPGVTIEPGEATNRELDAVVTFDGVTVLSSSVLGAVGSEGRRVTRWVADRAMVFLCALQVGVGEEAVRQAADYTSNREQFGRPLSTNQGVAMEVADAFIAVESMRVTLWQAAWRLAEGLDASKEVLVAKWWASQGARRALHLTQHVHGGIGVDVDYPFHRYFLWSKQLEVMLGGPSIQLARLGREIAGASA